MSYFTDTIRALKSDGFIAHAKEYKDMRARYYKRGSQIKRLERELADMTAFRDSEMRLANQYKQERDQAMKELAEYQRTEPLKLAERNELIKELNKFIKERDEAQECLLEAIDNYYALSPDGLGKGELQMILRWRKATGLTKSETSENAPIVNREGEQ